MPPDYSFTDHTCGLYGHDPPSNSPARVDGSEISGRCPYQARQNSTGCYLGRADFSSSSKVARTTWTITCRLDALHLSMVSCGVCQYRFRGPYWKSIKSMALTPAFTKGT